MKGFIILFLYLLPSLLFSEAMQDSVLTLSEMEERVQWLCMAQRLHDHLQNTQNEWENIRPSLNDTIRPRSRDEVLMFYNRLDPNQYRFEINCSKYGDDDLIYFYCVDPKESYYRYVVAFNAKGKCYLLQNFAPNDFSKLIHEYYGMIDSEKKAFEIALLFLKTMADTKHDELITSANIDNYASTMKGIEKPKIYRCVGGYQVNVFTVKEGHVWYGYYINIHTNGELQCNIVESDEFHF